MDLYTKKFNEISITDIGAVACGKNSSLVKCPKLCIKEEYAIRYLL